MDLLVDFTIRDCAFLLTGYLIGLQRADGKEFIVIIPLDMFEVIDEKL